MYTEELNGHGVTKHVNFIPYGEEERIVNALPDFKEWCKTPRTFAKNCIADIVYAVGGRISSLCDFLRAIRGVPTVILTIKDELLIEVLGNKNVQEMLTCVYPTTFRLRELTPKRYSFSAKHLEFLRDMWYLESLGLYVPMRDIGNLNSSIASMGSLKRLKIEIYLPSRLKGPALRQEEDCIVALYKNKPKECDMSLFLHTNQRLDRLFAKLLRMMKQEKHPVSLEIQVNAVVQEYTNPSRGGVVVHAVYSRESLASVIGNSEYYDRFVYLLQLGLCPSMMLRVEDYIG